VGKNLSLLGNSGRYARSGGETLIKKKAILGLVLEYLCAELSGIRKGDLDRSPFRNLWLSERLYVLSLPALWAFDHVELHALALLQAPETTGLNCREVHENIFPRLTADESVPFGIVEPLYCSLFHIYILFPFVYLRWRESEETCAGYWLLRRELLTTDSV
jgi:hypothetical protein